LLLTRKYVSVAMAYVGVVVGAGLSSGQDILQYFLSFGKAGIIAVIALGALNVVFGRIILTLGCYYHPASHQEVLNEIASPAVNRIIDLTLIASGFIIGFVMVAGAGANLQQQFGVPSWAGSLLCTLLVIVVAFLDFNRITHVLGIFTPIIIVMLLAVAAFTFFGRTVDWDAMDAAGRTIRPAVSNPFFAVINYFSLCAITAVSMAFVLGGSLVRIDSAAKGGALGGAIIGAIVLCASLSLLASLDAVKDADIPMLEIIRRISPAFAFAYTLVIFALIFNTAFALYYSTAKRFAKSGGRRLRIMISAIAAAGYLCSFFGFKTLISVMYPILGCVGIVMLLTLAAAWIREKRNIMHEKNLRETMIRLLTKKYDDDQEFTHRDRSRYEALGEASVADTESIKHCVREYVKYTQENS
jgi:uncharacterized membrane protein YkvI